MVYNKLTVTNTFRKRSYAGESMIMAECLCECGNTKAIQLCHVTSGRTKSCGCLVKKHGFKNHPVYGDVYHVFELMKYRCHSKTSKDYKYYGARGITVCDEWRYNPKAFVNWAISSGYKKGLTIERVDNNSGYSPDNCKWVSRSQQSKNTRNCVMITHNGITDNISGWANKYGIKIATLSWRLRKGQCFEMAISK